MFSNSSLLLSTSASAVDDKNGRLANASDRTVTPSSNPAQCALFTIQTVRRWKYKLQTDMMNTYRSGARGVGSTEVLAVCSRRG